MSQERARILKMVAEGKISVQEAEELLDALATQGDSEASESEVVAGKKPKWLRVQVDPGNGGKEKVNIRIPLQLIRAGAKLTSIMPGSAREKVNQALREKDIDLDLNNLDSEKLDDLLESLTELSINVEDGEEKVRIYCE